MRSKFSKCKLRVFRLVENINNLEEEAKGMTNLLKKFRIKFKARGINTSQIRVTL
jgi:hypothetical protein